MTLDTLSATTIREFLTFFQVITAVVCTIYYFKFKNTFLKYLVLVLWYFCINEFAAKYYKIYTGNHNSIFYNIKQIFEFTFYILLYKNSVKNVKDIKLMTWLLVFYYISVVINCFFNDFREVYFVENYLVGASCIVIGIILYFYETLNSDDIIYINKKLLFWISVGLLIYYLPSIPFKVVTKYYKNSPTVPYIYNINYLLVFLMNLLFISGFVWGNKEHK